MWNWFAELDATRQNGMGVGPITFVEIGKWAELTRKKPIPFEIEALRELDRAFLIHSNTKAKDKNG